MSKKDILFSLFCLAAMGIACSRTPTGTTPVPSMTSTERGSAPVDTGGAFAVGLEYAIPGLAQAYAPTGLTHAKPQPIFGMWGLIETAPGVFNWDPLDNLVVEYQQAGFGVLQLLITAESPWASLEPPTLINKGNTFPRDEYIDDYVRFVTLFVERYDGDGNADAPGLLFPVHHYGIEREFTGYWPGSAADYLRLLELASPAIHAADEQAQVLLVAILMVDVFDGNPEPAELLRRMDTPQAGIRKSVPEIQAILAACSLYDSLDFHSLGDYTEIPPTVAWLREQMQAAGCGTKPIWIGDAFSMSALVGYNGRPAWPATPENLDQVVATLKLVADPGETGHAEARAWLYGLMASNLVKKVIVSAAAGLAGINIGNLEDWKTSIPGLDAAAVPLVGTSMFMGMMDTKVTREESGKGLPPFRAPGPLRPAFHALQLVNAQLAGFTSVEKLDLGAGIWAYRFDRPTGPLWVVWHDDGRLYFPGEVTPALPVELPFEGNSARLTRTPVDEGAGNPERLSLAVHAGSLVFEVDQNPVFIEAGTE